MCGIFLIYLDAYMNNYDGESEKPRRGLIDSILSGTTLKEYEDILSEDLDAPDWHLKYARNIVRLILYISLGVLLTSLLFPRSLSGLNDLISRDIQVVCLIFLLICTGINEFFDTMLDQKSSLVWWYTHIRFLIVLLAVLSLIFVTLIKIIPILQLA